MRIQKWPIDVDELHKGDVITPERIEEITGEERGTKAYQFGRLHLARFIETERELRAAPLVVKHEGDGLRILFDDEAAEYTNGRFRSGLRIAAMSHYRQAAYVDVSQLSLAMQSRHERALLVNSRILQAMRQAQVESGVSTVPALP